MRLKLIALGIAVFGTLLASLGEVGVGQALVFGSAAVFATFLLNDFVISVQHRLDSYQE